MTGHIFCINLAVPCLISYFFSAFLFIDPISNMERTTLNCGPLRFAVGEKSHGVLVHERHVPQIEHHRLPRYLDDEQLLELLDILRLYPANESENHLTVC